MASAYGDWEPNNPLSLYQLTLQCCVSNTHVLCVFDEDSRYFFLRDGVSLPTQVCEDLLKAYKETDMRICDKFIHVFKDPKNTRLQHIDLSNTCISGQAVEWMMMHKPQELNISGCEETLCGSSSCVLQTIGTHGSNLTTLHIGDSIRYLLQNDYVNNCLESIGEEGQGDNAEQYIIDCPNLRVLSLHHLMDAEYEAPEFIQAVLRPLKRLSVLDLTGCNVHVECLDTSLLSNLTSLNLSDVAINNCMFRAFEILSKLTKLRQLILSQSRESPVTYPVPEEAMKMLMPRLQHLTYLDISGTNLCGFIPPELVEHRLGPDRQSTRMNVPAIPGLGGRCLEFLGLLGCPHDACHRENLPAKQVTGDANEKQVILAVHTYLAHPDMLMKALNQLFHIFRFADCIDQKGALLGILAAMKKHQDDKHIQISGSASLFYIMKGREKKNLNTRLKQGIIKAILSAMDKHKEESTMLRNGLLTLCHFQIPQDLIFAYQAVVSLLLQIIGQEGQEEFTQRIGVYLINSMACQVDGIEKLLVGDLGAIDTMVQLIQRKLTTDVCDEVMEIAWSAMWNVTDETPQNCRRFIDHNGLGLFLACLDKFPDRDELLRNMMGLIGNVAEVRELRAKLMEASYVKVFCDLLASTSDGIEVSYNACGVLAHLVADGEEEWTCPVPSRPQVLECMAQAIGRWKLKTRRNINYRSFEPILRLLSKFESPTAQHWAAWALCNLTKMYRSRYCPLLEREGGLKLLQDIVMRPMPDKYSDIKDLARQVLDRCHQYKARPSNLPTQDAVYTDEEDEEDEDMMSGEEEGMLQG